MRLCLTLRLWLLFKHTILYFYLGVPVPSTSEQKIDMEKKRGLMAFMGSIKAVTGVTRGKHWQCQVKTSGPCCCSSRLWLVAVLAILHDASLVLNERRVPEHGVFLRVADSSRAAEPAGRE